MKNNFKKLMKKAKVTIPFLSTGIILSTITLLELPFWVWLLIIISPIILGLIIAPIIWFVWKKKRSKDYANDPSQSRVDTFIKKRK